MFWDFFFFCNILEKENAVKLIFLLVWFGSAVSSCIHNTTRKDSESTPVAEQFQKDGKDYYYQFDFFLFCFEMLHLHLKTNIFQQFQQ